MDKGKKRVLVTGAGGFVGDRLCRYLRAGTGWEILGTSRSKGPGVDTVADLTDRHQVEELKAGFPADIVIHSAAVARTDVCEADRELCHRINVVSTKNLLDAFSPAKFFYFSTYAVYNTPGGNCTESAPTHPTNYYIETKLESEKLVSAHPGSVILRPSVIFGYTAIERTSRNYFMQLLDNVRSHRKMQSPTDQYFNPVHVDLVCTIILQAISRDIAGIYNIGSNEPVSKFSFNQKVMRRFGFDESYLEGIDSSALAVKRPNNGTISSRAIQEALGMTFPSFDEMIEDLYRSAGPAAAPLRDKA